MGEVDEQLNPRRAGKENRSTPPAGRRPRPVASARPGLRNTEEENGVPYTNCKPFPLEIEADRKSSLHIM